MARRSVAAAGIGAALLVPAFWFALHAQSWQPASGGSATKWEVPAVRYEYPEQVSVAAGKPASFDLHFRIRDGLHINSHAPLQKSLIRTELIVDEPPGVNVVSVDFPTGSDYALKALPNEKLSVYTGEVVLHAHVIAQPGEHLLQAALRYQACDTDSCYPPKKAPVAVDLVAR